MSFISIFSHELTQPQYLLWVNRESNITPQIVNSCREKPVSADFHVSSTSMDFDETGSVMRNSSYMTTTTPPCLSPMYDRFFIKNFFTCSQCGSICSSQLVSEIATVLYHGVPLIFLKFSLKYFFFRTLTLSMRMKGQEQS